MRDRDLRPGSRRGADYQRPGPHESIQQDAFNVNDSDIPQPHLCFAFGNDPDEKTQVLRGQAVID